MSGVITSSQVETPSDVHVALVWTSGFVGGGAQAVAQDLDVHAQFPAKFRLDVDSLPPEAAMLDAGKSRTAFGYLVVYDDKNGNGKLDLLSFDDKEPVDRLLGKPDRLEIAYFEGELPPDFTAHPGFNLWQYPASCPPSGFQQQCQAELLPQDTEIEVTLTGEPGLPAWMCASNPFTQRGLTQGAKVFSWYPALATAGITCDADGSGFDYEACHEDSACMPAFCRSGHIPLNIFSTSTQPVPSDWPCTVGQ